ncbi:kmo [Symbiodinium microadriaticum]|nr:kmo [Symbiodinium microadriaticum]
MALFDKGDVVVVGAGLVGSLLAYILQKKGYRVTIFERYQDIRQIPSLGRSINLVITSRGLRAVDMIGGGLRDEVLALATTVTGRILHQTDGSVQFQRYGKDDSECNYSISRFELNKFLIQKAEEAGAELFFGHELVVDGTNFLDNENNNGIDVGCTLEFRLNGEMKRVNCACPVFGCDGGGSRARYAMRAGGLCEFEESLLGTETGGSPHVYKEMLFPKGSGLADHGLHIWPRRNHMLMALANLDGSMTGTLYMDKKGEESFETVDDEAKGQAFFEQYYADAISMIGGIARVNEQMLHNPNGLLGTVRTTKFNYRGRVVLLGDAAHAITPFFGQGMNCGFEDVYQLITLLDANNCRGGSMSMDGPVTPMEAGLAVSWKIAFDTFHEARKPNADAVADLALANFHEMRDHTADRSFLLQKKVENRLENAFESKFRSGYSMVCYGGCGPRDVTYYKALILGKVQDAMLKELIKDAAVELEAMPADADWPSRMEELADNISLERAGQLIDEIVAPVRRELDVDISTVSH